MQSSDPRAVLLRALLLDWLGQLVIVGLIVFQREGMPFMLEMSQLGATGPWLCLLYTSPSPRDLSTSRMPSSA